MALLKNMLLGLIAFNAFQLISAAAPSLDELGDDRLAADDPQASLRASVPPAVSINTTFPSAEIFGIKLVNGQKNPAIIHVQNAEDAPIKIHLIGGSLWSLPPDFDVVRNLSMARANLEIAPGDTGELEYIINTELHPQDLRLMLGAVVEHPEGQFSQVTAFNGTVSIVDAPISMFDPQMMFLWLFLGTLFGGMCYFIYRTWVRSLFPQKRSPRGKGKKVDTGSSDSATTATASGAKGYDESWIPAQHLQRPEARKIRSNTPKTKSK